MAILFSCTKDNEGTYTVKYKVSSSSTMNVSYTDMDGTLKLANNVSATWTYEFKTSGNGQLVKLIINSTNGSRVSGSILINGQQATQNDSDNGYVTMSAQVN